MDAVQDWNGSVYLDHGIRTRHCPALCGRGWISGICSLYIGAVPFGDDGCGRDETTGNLLSL